MLFHLLIPKIFETLVICLCLMLVGYVFWYNIIKGKLKRPKKGIYICLIFASVIFAYFSYKSLVCSASEGIKSAVDKYEKINSNLKVTMANPFNLTYKIIVKVKKENQRQSGVKSYEFELSANKLDKMVITWTDKKNKKFETEIKKNKNKLQIILNEFVASLILLLSVIIVFMCPKTRLMKKNKSQLIMYIIFLYAGFIDPEIKNWYFVIMISLLYGTIDYLKGIRDSLFIYCSIFGIIFNFRLEKFKKHHFNFRLEEFLKHLFN